MGSTLETQFFAFPCFENFTNVGAENSIFALFLKAYYRRKDGAWCSNKRGKDGEPLPASLPRGPLSPCPAPGLHPPAGTTR